jgi:hypothetical protein
MGNRKGHNVVALRRFQPHLSSRFVCYDLQKSLFRIINLPGQKSVTPLFAMMAEKTRTFSG